MNSGLAALLTRPDLWRGTPAASSSAAALPTGHAALDALLPGGGWPLGALTELCYPQDGMGELRVLMPALAHLTRAQRWIALVAAPHPLYAPALAAAGLELARVVFVGEKRGSECLSRSEKTESTRPFPRERHSDPLFSLWAAEQALRSGACGAVVLWPRTIDDRGLRRLQLAAEAGRNWCVALRPLAALTQASPAALRLQLERGPRVRLLKCRGATRAGGITDLLFPQHRDVQVSRAQDAQERPQHRDVPVSRAAAPASLPPAALGHPCPSQDAQERPPRVAPRAVAPGILPIHPSRKTHALAGARISAPGAGCPR